MSKASARVGQEAIACSMESFAGEPQKQQGSVTSLCSLAEVHQPLSYVRKASILIPCGASRYAFTKLSPQTSNLNFMIFDQRSETSCSVAGG